jgi:hypothetical protein
MIIKKETYMMNFSFVLNRARNLIVNPKAEWAVIQKESQGKSVIIKTYALPLIIMMAACSVLGAIITVSNVAYAIIKALGIFGFSYAGMYVSALIINELTTSFNSKKDLNTTFRLVVYSLTGFFIIKSFVLLWPPIEMLSVLGLFSVYLFWEGSATLLETPEDNKIGFVAVSTVVVAGVYAILYLILEGILTNVLAVKFIA